MIVQDRHGAILEQLNARPRIRLTALQRRLGVSRSTLRRDLMELEGLGKVVRLRGLVIHADHLHGEPSYDLRRSHQVSQKQAIGKSAAKLAPPNASIYIDAGTTTMEAARLLLDRADLRIFTNSLRVIRRAVASQSPAVVTCIGGTLKPVSEALVGAPAISWLDGLRFDIVLMGASGLDADGPSTTELLEADLKRKVISRAKQVAILADLSKWNEPSAVRFANWDDIDLLVTESSPPAELADLLSRHKVRSIHGENES
jgi:DeoR family transcriptional regulator, fructose operon transcriptional repressor